MSPADISPPELASADPHILAERLQLVIERDGSQWRANFRDFVDLQVSPAGFGRTVLEAVAALAHEARRPQPPLVTGV
jgi:hypothetical protein